MLDRNRKSELIKLMKDKIKEMDNNKVHSDPDPNLNPISSPTPTFFRKIKMMIGRNKKRNMNKLYTQSKKLSNLSLSH